MHRDETTSSFEETKEQEANYLSDSLGDDDEGLSYSEDSVESLEDSGSIDALEVATNTQTNILNGEALEGVIDLTGEGCSDDKNTTHMDALEVSISSVTNILTTKAIPLENVVDVGGEDDFDDESAIHKNVLQVVINTEANSLEGVAGKGFDDKSAMQIIASEDAIGAETEISTTKAISIEGFARFEEKGSSDDTSTIGTANIYLKLKQNEATDEANEEENGVQKLQKTKSWDMLIFSDDERSLEGDLEGEHGLDAVEVANDAKKLISTIEAIHFEELQKLQNTKSLDVLLFSDDVNEASTAWFSVEGTNSQHYYAEPVTYELEEGVQATLLGAFAESEHIEQTKDQDEVNYKEEAAKEKGGKAGQNV